MSNCLILFFALLELTLAAEFSVPLRKSGTPSSYSKHLAQHKIQKLSVHQQHLADILDEFYVTDIALGTPDQHFIVTFDTASSVLWVLDSTCDSTNCKGNATAGLTEKDAYDSTRSSTFLDSNKNFLFPYSGSEVYGLLGKEKVSFSGFTLTNQDFIRATVLPEVFTQQPIEGVLGLGWAPQAELKGVGNPMQALLPQLDQPVFSLWLQKKANIGTTGAITFGGIDNVACDKKVQYLPLAEPGVWGFNVDGSSIGAYSKMQKGKAISTSGSGWTGVPNTVLSQIVKATKAKYDWVHELYTVPCSTHASYPDLKLTIGGNIYHITSADYVIDIELENDQCVLAFFGSDNVQPVADWLLGDAFIRSYCHIYDFGNARMGLSKFVKRD